MRWTTQISWCHLRSTPDEDKLRNPDQKCLVGYEKDIFLCFCIHMRIRKKKKGLHASNTSNSFHTLITKLLSGSREDSPLKKCIPCTTKQRQQMRQWNHDMSSIWIVCSTSLTRRHLLYVACWHSLMCESNILKQHYHVSSVFMPWHKDHLRLIPMKLQLTVNEHWCLNKLNVGIKDWVRLWLE